MRLKHFKIIAIALHYTHEKRQKRCIIVMSPKGDFDSRAVARDCLASLLT